MSNITPSTPEVQAEPAYHPDIQAAIDGIPKMLECLKAANRFMFIAADLEKRFPGHYMWRVLTHGDWLVCIAFKFDALSEAVEVLKYLAVEHGVHQNQKMWVYQDDKSLNWRFEGMRLSGHFASPEAKCKFVQTGTKVVPVYTMTCDGAAVPEITEEPKQLAMEGVPF